MRRLETSRRFAGLIAVLVVAAGITAASAQTENRGGHDKRAGLELTYTKWFEPERPHMVGVVGGDIDGKFGGAFLEAKADPSGDFQLKAIYIVLASDPSRSLTMRVDGTQNAEGAAVLKGRVIDGSLTGARVQVSSQRFDCDQSPGPCFQGTISIKRRSGDDDD